MSTKTGLCLSVQQPWAWLIVHGHKPVENRTWPTRARGWVGIHAGQKVDAEGYEWIRREFPEIAMPAPEEFERGGIVGRAQIVGCVHERDSSLLAERDRQWFFGPYGFVFDRAEPLDFVPCRGKLGFFRPELAAPTPALESERA